MSTFATTLPSDEMEVDLQEVQDLVDSLYQHYGFDFRDYALSSFKRRIIMVLKKNGLKSVDKLRERLMTDQVFFDQFILDITVNTTEMFRDPTFFEALQQQVFPQLHAKEEFNVWHAACSTGEEVVSLAILLKEAGLYNRANIYATDLNSVVLERAQQARYPRRNLELSQANYSAVNPKGKFERYYTLDSDYFTFHPELLKRVTFKKHNLVSDSSFYKFDLILCRNVLIYFNQELQNRVFSLLHGSMFLNAHLCLGSKESLVWCRIADKFKAVNENEKIYQKAKL